MSKIKKRTCLKYTKITKYFVQKHKMRGLVKNSKLIDKHYKWELEEKPDFPWEDKGKQEKMARNRCFRRELRKIQGGKAG